MQKTEKRIGALALVLALTLAMLPGTAYAADIDIPADDMVSMNYSGEVPTPADGNYTIKLFNEECNGDNYTNFTSTSETIPMPMAADVPVVTSMTPNSDITSSGGPFLVTIHGQNLTKENISLHDGTEFQSLSIHDTGTQAAYSAFLPANYANATEIVTFTVWLNGIPTSHTCTVTIAAAAPEIANFTASPINLTYEGGQSTLTILGKNLNHYTLKIAEYLDADSSVRNLWTLPASANGTFRVTFAVTLPPNTTMIDQVYTYKLDYDNQIWQDGDNKVEVTVAAALPVLNTGALTASPNHFDWVGGTTTLTVRGENLHNFTSLCIKDNYGNTYSISSGDISADKKSAAVTVQLPANTSSFDKIYTFELYNGATATGETATVKVKVPTLTMLPSSATVIIGTAADGDTVATATTANFSGTPITYSIDSGTLPLGLSLNTTTGEIYVATATALVATSGTTVTVKAEYNAESATDTVTITIQDAPLPNTHTVTDTANQYTPPSSYTQPAYTYSHIMVYGVRVDYSIENATGILTFNLTRGQLDGIVKAAGGGVTHTALNLTGMSGIKGIDIHFPPAWFAEHPAVTFPVQTDMGGVNLNSNAAMKFPAQDTTGTISLRTGSVWLSAKQSGKAVTWNSFNAPVIVYVPYALKAGTDANTLILYDKATGKTVPHSFYANGRVYGAVNRPGEYEVKAAAISFTDTAGHWAEDDIAFAISRGLIGGTTSATFAPGTAITRADFLMALGKLSDADMSGFKTSGFTDVSNDNPAMPYIEWAAANKIVTGTGGGKFAPNAPITREEMALMMVNYANATGQTLSATRQAVTFSDAAKISDWAKDAVAAVQQANIITGKPDNLYDPKGSTTRAEAAAILRRFAESTANGRLGWVQTDKGEWQYIQSDYLPKTGWLSTTEGNKYYFDKDGFRAFGEWLPISGKWYYFYPDGKLAADTTIDDYEIGTDGARK